MLLIGAKGWSEPAFYKRAFVMITRILPRVLLQSSMNVQRTQGGAVRLFAMHSDQRLKIILYIHRTQAWFFIALTEYNIIQNQQKVYL